MAVLKDIEVLIVSTSGDLAIDEFDKPEANTSSHKHSSEKYIEAITGLT